MMMLPKIPLHLCNQSVVLHMATGDEDDYGKPKTTDVAVNHVIVQPQTIYSGSNNSRRSQQMRSSFCLRVFHRQCPDWRQTVLAGISRLKITTTRSLISLTIVIHTAMMCTPMNWRCCNGRSYQNRR